MYTLGVDIGSTSSKAVILQDGKDIVSKSVVPLGTGTVGPEQVYENVFRGTGLTQADISRTVATGYGRLKCSYADEQVSELSCHAKGVNLLLPSARTVIDIGGQDAKVLRIDEAGHLLNFQMNDKCAAGTGRFLEVMAKVMNLDINDLGAISEKAQHPAKISNTCTVFAESEVISQLASGVGVDNIAAGIHTSVAKRVFGMASRIGCVPAFAISGGVALNVGVVHALEQEFGQPVMAHPYCQLAGAIGASRLAWKSLQKKGELHE